MSTIQRNSVNKVILIGRLGNDPELHKTKTDVPVVSVSLATNELWKTQDGDKHHTEWHRIVLWRGLAELASQYLKKGSLVFIEGRLRTRSWEDKEGNGRSSTEVIADQVQFLDSKEPAAEQPAPEEDAPPIDEDELKALACEDQG